MPEWAQEVEAITTEGVGNPGNREKELMTLQPPCPSWKNIPPICGNLPGQSWEQPFPDSRKIPGVFPEGSRSGIHWYDKLLRSSSPGSSRIP